MTSDGTVDVSDSGTAVEVAAGSEGTRSIPEDFLEKTSR
jgi:hypothetical protein